MLARMTGVARARGPYGDTGRDLSNGHDYINGNRD